jgi:hypothetical protein
MNSDNTKFYCRFCSFSSNRKYNRDVHETRKHSPKMINESSQSANLEPFSYSNVNPMIPTSPPGFSSLSIPIIDLDFNLNSIETEKKLEKMKEITRKRYGNLEIQLYCHHYLLKILNQTIIK